jgi:hypothetical protein
MEVLDPDIPKEELQNQVNQFIVESQKQEGSCCKVSYHHYHKAKEGS